MEIKCKDCGNEMEHEDTLDHYGGIEDGYIIEHQLWSCEKCEKDFIVDKRLDFKKEDINIIYFEEC